jgi:hypothetical protein
MQARNTTLAALLAVVVAAGCGGGGSGPTAPTVTSCNSSFGGDWRWIIKSGCNVQLLTGVSHPTSFDQSSCRVTLDVTPDAVKAAGQTFMMTVNFGDGSATFTKSGTSCDGTDQGSIKTSGATGWDVVFHPSKSDKCCQFDYEVSLSH